MVERSTAKDPGNRYQHVGEMIDDLSTALEVEAARAGSTTGEATSVLEAVPPPKRELLGPRALELAAIAGLVLVAGAVLLAVQLISSSGLGGGGANDGKGKPVSLDLGDRLRPAGRRRRGRQQDRTRRRRRPHRDGLGNRALRLRRLRWDQGRPQRGGRRLRDGELAVQADQDDRPHPDSGWDAQVFAAASGPPGEVSEWGEPVGIAIDASSVEEIDLTVPQPSRYFLLWFNKASEARDQPGRYQVEITDIELLR